MLCKNGHYYSGSYCKTCEERPEKKSQRPIPKRSKKRLKQESEYSKARKIYLEHFPVCEVWNCGEKSTEIHHLQGKVGSLLIDVNNFLAVCRKCHDYIHDNHAWSIEQGYKIERSK